jgi:cytochrome bd-type quinol oxidase subunit 2
MNKKFLLEFITGTILLASVIIFGQKGMVALVLLSIYPLIKKKKELDEREIQLFNKIGNLTAGITLFISVIIYYFSDIAINDLKIGENWLFFILSAFLISHGTTGLIVFNEK